MKITFLGTGTSHGIPVIGCACPVCRSRDPKDRRNRASVLVEAHGQTVLIDVAPEFRLQALASGLRRADALLLTHAHADHIGGLDDVRIFSEHSGQLFPVYGPATALAGVRERFGYVFRRTQAGGGKPRLALLPVSKPFCLGSLKVEPLPAWHGRVRVFGYRLGTFAYMTDISKIPPCLYARLRGLEVLVLGALRKEPHETHFHLERAIAEARRIGAQRTYFTHMCHRLGHRQTQKSLPAGMALAYDGLTLRLPEPDIS